MNVSAWGIDLSAKTIMIILIGALSFVSVGMLYRFSHKKYAFQGDTEIEHIQVARWKNVLVIAFGILTMVLYYKEAVRLSAYADSYWKSFGVMVAYKRVISYGDMSLNPVVNQMTKMVYLHEKYIEYFMKLMLDHNAEIATTDTILSFIGDAPVSTDLDFNKYNVISGEDAAKEMLMYTLQIGPWNKLIKKSLIEREGISFHEQFYCGEGFAFSVECFQSTNKVVVGHQNVYFYRIDNATSGSSTFSLGKYKSSVNAQDYMRNVLKDKSQYADNVLKFSKWRTLSDNFTLLKASGDEDRYPEIYHELKIEVKKGALGALKIPVKPKQKIRAFAFWISPEMAAYVFSSYLNHKMGGKFQRNMNISGGGQRIN